MVGYGLDVSRKYEVDTDPSGALYEESEIKSLSFVVPMQAMFHHQLLVSHF